MTAQCDFERINLPNSELLFWPTFLSDQEASVLFSVAREQAGWVQSTIRIAGREIPIPRLNAMYGDEGTDYSYSGTRLPVNPWSEDLESIRHRVSQVSGFAFNTVLLNLYRDGNDSVGWHSDNEKELGEQPAVATLSLGAERRFDLRPCLQATTKARTRRKTSHLNLPHGSLLIMAGDTQSHWQHRIAKVKGTVAERISLTFRQVCRPAGDSYACKDMSVTESQ